MKQRLRRVIDELRLPAVARFERRRDARGLCEGDPGTERTLPSLIAWLALAQDCSRSADGGVARDFSLLEGWSSSYPETTGYIVPTLLTWARRQGDTEARARALRMADWLVSIQLPGGGFQGGKIDSSPVVPVVFNTGQILIGLAAAQAETGAYLEPMRRAADWLVSAQDPDGCWRRYASPFALAGEKQYDTHVAWGLFEAARLEPGRGWSEAGLRNVHWALSLQRPNGWMPRCCLSNVARPLTHTLAYALRGVIEAYRLQPEPAVLDGAERLANGMLGALGADGFLPGRLAPDWSAAASWSCLTGSAQAAACWLLLYDATGRSRYLDAARRANRYVRRTIRLDAPAEQRGAVKGSFPVDGDYCRFEYPNWAAKFLADSLMLEASLVPTSEQAAGQAQASQSSATSPI